MDKTMIDEMIHSKNLLDWAAEMRASGRVKNIEPLRYPDNGGFVEVKFSEGDNPLENTAFKNFLKGLQDFTN